MNKIIKFRRKKTPRQIAIITISMAVIIGFVVGIFLPDDISVFKSLTNPSNIIQADITGYASVTDGDTIKINGERIRFHGIDAPEIDQVCKISVMSYNCGIKAKDYLYQIINNQPVSCIRQSKDQYGRTIAECYNYKGEDIEALMVLNGQAVAYYYYTWDYALEEMRARYNNVGIWAGEFEDPYQYRRNKR